MSSQGQPRAALAQVTAGVMAVELSDAQIERLADLLAERLQAPPMLGAPVAGRLVSADAIARELGISRTHVYAPELVKAVARAVEAQAGDMDDVADLIDVWERSAAGALIGDGGSA